MHFIAFEAINNGYPPLKPNSIKSNISALASSGIHSCTTRQLRCERVQPVSVYYSARCSMELLPNSRYNYPSCGIDYGNPCEAFPEK
ncbi:hypothetical protein CEXT_489981 [Caerostris extrusa]|uniref:Kazal-like domain-containing protein n=1 Tax=Caerostris extrusa TaxID=172846 RepID=A0AAV4XYH9_CAEEX|nr:hypothetical protein CEXT_489981 [Caerostris extrusa]